VGALPKALGKTGAKPTIMIPAYKSANLERLDVRPCDLLPRFSIPMGPSSEEAVLYQTRIENTGMDVYLIGSGKYFDRAGIYDDPVTREGYPDNIERFIFFMKAGLEVILRLGIRADIIHCHDSHSALIPGLIHINFRGHPFLAHVGTLFTIHNLAHQGLDSRESLYYAGIDYKHFYPMSPLEYWDKVNFMKAGILFADKVNTVSQTYAKEIMSSHDYGFGLEGVLQNRAKDVSGIVNGIDYEEWNPETDPLIPAHFSMSDLSGKSKCKNHLLEYFGLPGTQNRVPLIGIVSRLADQKGIDLIAEAIEEIMAMDVQLVVLGTGQQKYHDFFRQITAQYPEKISVRLFFDNELAHKIEAGCDMFLMPSKYEPCGLNQLYSMRYGTIPVVRATGGLADTVINWGDERGTGFSFAHYTAREMMSAIRKAVAVYSDPALWTPLMVRAMSADWSWHRSAEQYMNLYRAIYLKRHRK
jgi:starch synthase